MGVVVRRYIDILTKIINFPYSTCISSFFSSSIPTSLFTFLKCVFGLVSVNVLQYIANVTQRTFEIVKKIEIREYNYFIKSIIKNIERASTARVRVPRLPRARY